MTFCSKPPFIIGSLRDGMSRLLSSCYISPMYSLSNELISCVQIKRGKEDLNGDSTTTKNPCGCHFITTGSFLSPHAQNEKKNFDAGIKPGPLVWGKVKWSEHLCDENVNVGVWDSWGMTIHKLAPQATTPPITPGLPGTASKWDIGLARHWKKVTCYLLPYCAKTLRKILKSYLEPFCLKMNSSEENVCRFLSSKTQSNAYYNYSFVSNPSKNLKMKIALQLSKDERAKFQKFMIKLPPLVPRTTIWI